MCVFGSPDCVGDVADAEAAGRLRRLPAVVPPHVPLGLRHKLKGLPCWGQLGRLHGVAPVHLRSPRPTKSNTIKKSVGPQISVFMSSGLPVVVVKMVVKKVVKKAVKIVEKTAGRPAGATLYF